MEIANGRILSNISIPVSPKLSVFFHFNLANSLGKKINISQNTIAAEAISSTRPAPMIAINGIAVLVHNPPPIKGSCMICLQAKASAAGVS